MDNITLDLTASFAHVNSPTPFGSYDSNTSFQQTADSMVRLVYATFGGHVLAVEMTNKDVYSSLEQSLLEYSAIVNSYHAKSVRCHPHALRLVPAHSKPLKGNFDIVSLWVALDQIL